MNRASFSVAAWLSLVCLLAIGRSSSVAVTYTVVDLGSAYSISGYQSKVINDRGEVIGNDATVTKHGFVYSGGTWHDLGALNTSGMGNAGSFVAGINNLGAMVGYADTGRGVQVDGFLHSGVAGTMSALNLAGAGDVAKDAIAKALNDLGTIVGTVVHNDTGAAEPFLHRSAMGSFAPPNGAVSSFAINNYGDALGQKIVGGVLGTTTVQPLLNGVPLPALANGFRPHAINNAGQILLSVDDLAPIKGAWGLIYDYGTGKTTKLGNLSPFSANFGSFRDINDLGEVVGRGADPNSNPHAVFFSPATGMISLDALNLTAGGMAIHLTDAHGINNLGQIVCTGYIDDPSIVHGFLLTPDTPSVLPLVATYDGLAVFGGASAGVVTIGVGKTNIASVKLTAPGVSHAFKVTLTNGSFSGNVTVKDVVLTVVLTADASHRNITGSIADPNRTYALAARRQAKLGVFAGSYTALLQISGPGGGLPQGVGFGAMKVSKTGAVSIKGQLGDGSVYSAAAMLHYDGSWTFYAPLYTKTLSPGAIVGSMTFNRAATDSDCAGILRWSKPNEFNPDVTCKAALFTRVKDTQILQFTNTTAGVGTFEFAGGEQTLAAKSVSVTNKNVVTVTAPSPDPDALVVKLSTSTGALTGSFLHPGLGKKAPFVGVIQQKLNLGGGVFKGPTTAGGVLLTPQ